MLHLSLSLSHSRIHKLFFESSKCLRTKKKQFSRLVEANGVELKVNGAQKVMMMIKMRGREGFSTGKATNLAPSRDDFSLGLSYIMRKESTGSKKET